MDYINAFIVGGLICVIAQILVDKTRLTAARILVLFVVVGCLLSGMGIYGKIVDFAGAGATIPLPGFGHLLAQGVIREVETNGLLGILTGGMKAAAGGITSAVVFAFFAAICFNPKEKA